MTQITIPLIAGRNYISFPAISSDNFEGIFISSGIMDNIEKFFTYDAISGWMDVSCFEYIKEGRGYILDMTNPGDIIYDGIEYTLTFDQLKSRILEGWNLVGPGAVPIASPFWCRAIDMKTGSSVTQLEPKNAYLIYYYSCIAPKGEPVLLISSFSLGIAIISLLIALKSVRP